jgi:hypothetical protein
MPEGPKLYSLQQNHKNVLATYMKRLKEAKVLSPEKHQNMTPYQKADEIIFYQQKQNTLVNH